MKQAQQMQKAMQDMQEKLAAKEVVGKSGGGLVEVVLNGKGDFKKLDINQDLLKPSEKEVLQDLILAAYANAKEKIESDFSSEMSGLASQYGLPEGFKL